MTLTVADFQVGDKVNYVSGPRNAHAPSRIQGEVLFVGAQLIVVRWPHGREQAYKPVKLKKPTREELL